MPTDTGKPQAVLFDVDGTLVDTTEMILHTLGETYRKFLGVEVGREEIRAVIGRPLDVQVRLFDDRANLRPDYDEMRRYQIELYEANKHLEHPIPEALEAVRVCARKGISTALVTSKEAREFAGTLPRLDLQGALTTSVTSTDSPRPKPYPDPVLLAAERMGLPPSAAVFVGDTDYDIQCGSAAGARTAAVLWGAQTEERLAQARPDMVFRHPADLLRWCESL